jgi:hypothetical protein
MDATSQKRYAVVSCHVEQPLDDRAWAAFTRLQERRPGGFGVAALMRPPDPEVGEDEERWLERAREAAARAPLGHHTHWTSPTHARPTGGGDPGARVLHEGTWLRERGLAPTLFCGGGWYTDASVAAACAELGYVDCTPRATRPSYLAPEASWAQLAAPARINVGGASLLAVPTTRTIGDLARTVWRPSGLPEAVVHVYLHDTDLLDARRRAALGLGLRALGRRRRPADLDTVASALAAFAPEVAWADVARGGRSREGAAVESERARKGPA